MNRKLRIFALFAILSLLALARGVRGDDNDESDESAVAEIIQLIQSPEQSTDQSDERSDEQPHDKPADTNKSGEKPLEELVPKPDSLMPHFDPEGAEGAAFDNGTTPARWIDRNYQFLNEGDPYPPGQDPLRERPGIAVGWFAGVDINVVQPSIHSQAVNTSLGPGDPFTGTFTNSTLLPTGEMNWTVMPKIQLGYRRENGLGEFVASYRYVQSDGSGTILHFDTAGAGSFNSRTQAHVLDLVYGFSDRTDDLPWFLPTIRRYSVGLRVASWIFDTTANGAQTLEERAGNVFIGGGPVLSYDWLWFTAAPGLTFDGGFDAAGVGGFNYQRFAETAILPGGINSARGRTDGSGTATPILGVWGGFAWAPDWGNGTLKFSAGYRWERWWNLPDAGGQNELTLQGPYLRGEFRW